MHLNTNQVFSIEVVFLQLKLVTCYPVILLVCIVMTVHTSVSFRWIIGWLIIITINRKTDRALSAVTLQKNVKRGEQALTATLACWKIM